MKGDTIEGGKDSMNSSLDRSTVRKGRTDFLDYSKTESMDRLFEAVNALKKEVKGKLKTRAKG